MVKWRFKKSTELLEIVEVNRMFKFLSFNSEMNHSQSVLLPTEFVQKTNSDKFSSSLPELSTFTPETRNSEGAILTGKM